MPNRLQTEAINIPVGSALTSTGTWTLVTNSGAPYLSKAAAAGVSKIVFPIPIPQQYGQHGVSLTSVEIPIRVATANLVSTPTVAIYRRDNLAVAAAGVNMAASTITATSTGATLTLATTDRKITTTITTPALDTTSNYAYNAQLTMNAATTSAIRVYDAKAYFTMVV